ncbi:L-asparaginase precursor protein [Rutstroemia sp. NJR-2017a WRK4]|nr:L-asparaginase precursor protein [Rutstroemia sp. NJR-2017a WRK4]
MEYKSQSSSSSQKITPRIIIHGGAGNILPANLPPAKYKLYHDSLLKILSNTHHFLTSPSSFPLASSSNSVTSALDAVTFAVTQLEDNPLFNSGHGAVFTRDGINELEVSIMVSKGKKKRGVGLMGLQHVKNPIKLAREMLIRGERDLEGGNGEHRGPMVVEEEDKKRSSGAQGHSQLHKYSAEKLAKEWGLEIVDEKYFFVQARWDEHISGLEKERKGQGVASWDAKDFISQGTCGAVALDADGVLCVGTSTGGMTNKLTGRIGDTPTLGAGFWAEEWEESTSAATYENMLRQRMGSQAPVLELTDSLRGLLADCLPSLRTYSPVPSQAIDEKASRELKTFRSAAMSGTGNGDSFLRVAAVRTSSAIARYRPHTSLQTAVTEITGPGGELVKSAGDRWKKTGEGEGGIIGIESKVVVDESGRTKDAVADVVYDYNCGGMFRAWVNAEGKAVMRVWREGQYDGLEIYEGEGKEYDVAEWID